MRFAAKLILAMFLAIILSPLAAATVLWGLAFGPDHSRKH